MGALFSLPVTLLNALLPFTNANTPLYQDLVHTAVLCGTLYFAPQIAEWYNAQQTKQWDGDEQTQQDDTDDLIQREEAEAEGNLQYQVNEDPPLDERLVLQEDDDQPPPQAPTPPPNQAHVQDFHADPHGIPPDPHNFLDNNAAGGPANDRPRPTSANRTIGAKKAKSLARKDQRRAYHEFHRQEAELRRLQQAEGAEEREAALTAEQDRRKKIEDEIRDKEREERERAKREREREAEEEAERREKCIERVRSGVQGTGAVDLVDEAWKEGKDRVWVERLVRASGLLAQLQRDEGTHVMITGHGWLVRVDRKLMDRVYADAEGFGKRCGGKVGFDEIGGLLEKAVLARAKA